jgi:hypothetical protein
MGQLNVASPGLKWFYPLVTGVFLGILQTGLFFQLTFTFSSGFGTYLLITLCWLFGSVIGVTFIASTRVPTLFLLLSSLAGYGLCSLIPVFFPFETSLWWLYAVMIVGVGVFPGVFFARTADQYKASQLFLWENNGFVTGMAGGILLFLLLGRPILWIVPFLLAALVVKVRV